MGQPGCCHTHLIREGEKSPRLHSPGEDGLKTGHNSTNNNFKWLGEGCGESEPPPTPGSESAGENTSTKSEGQGRMEAELSTSPGSESAGDLEDTHTLKNRACNNNRQGNQGEHLSNKLNHRCQPKAGGEGRGGAREENQGHVGRKGNRGGRGHVGAAN